MNLKETKLMAERDEWLAYMREHGEMGLRSYRKWVDSLNNQAALKKAKRAAERQDRVRELDEIFNDEEV